MAIAWDIFIYRLPVNPSRTRVAVWRELRKLGALPLQQSVVAVPIIDELVVRLDAVEARIQGEGGTVYRFRLDDLSVDQRERFVHEWNEIRDHEYGEIIEECETRFRSEVEFELFRGNLTGSEAEEIEADLDKIRSWFERVSERDRFTASRRAEALRAIEASHVLLDDFVERVFEAEAAHGGLSLELPEPRLRKVDLSQTTNQDTPNDDLVKLSGPARLGSKRRSPAAPAGDE